MGTGGSVQFLRICVGRAALGSGTALAVIGFHPQSHILGHPCFPPQGKNRVCCMLAVPWDFRTMLRMDLAAEMKLQKNLAAEGKRRKVKIKLEHSARILLICRVPGELGPCLDGNEEPEPFGVWTNISKNII